MSADVKIPSDLQMCCPDCAGNGEVDSGGTTPQGSAIFLCCPRCGGEGSIIKDNPNLEEHLDRLDAMISNDGQWDWSDNDIEALKGIRDELRIQCAYNRLLTADRDLWQRKCEMMARPASEWISVGERLPEATVGQKGEPPIISDDVFCYWPADGGIIEVCNYDHEDKMWSLVHKSFAEPDCEPTHWMPEPDPPPAARLALPAQGGTGEKAP